MSKTMRNTIIIIAIIILVVAIGFAVYNILKTKSTNTNSIGNIFSNEENQNIENVIDNNLNETNTENTENENTNNNINSNSQKEEESKEDNQLTPKQKKAIELAKQEWKREWGNLNDINFGYESMQGEKYIVSVRDNITADNIRFYIVDLITGEVEVR